MKKFLNQTKLTMHLQKFEKRIRYSRSLTPLQKCKSYGPRTLNGRLFKSYLNHRKQCIATNHANLKLRAVRFGFPQGSLLVPLLLISFINDINSNQENKKSRIYADDTK